MTRFRDIVDSPCGIRHVFENLELSSGYSRKFLLDTYMMHSREEIESHYVGVQAAVRIVAAPAVYESVTSRLCELRDIEPTLVRLGCGETLDDIELFEIKHLSLLSEKVKSCVLNAIVDESVQSLPKIESLEGAVSILDPDGLRIQSFYVYDSYSGQLAALRRQYRVSPSAELEVQMAQMEREIRSELSISLRSHVTSLKHNLKALAELDIFIAQARQMEENGYVIPKILEPGAVTGYSGLFHPYISDLLAASGKSFQAVDVNVQPGTTMLIGVNMGGKTVVLKMLAMVQYMTQFGFALPATAARVAPKDQVLFVIGDSEHTERGLSSFAGEVEAIDNVIKTARSGVDLLALIDEPARTTNPTEGSALVSSLVSTLSELNVTTVITTHYDIPETQGRLLRVRGFVNGRMDYSLVEAVSGDVPHEAIDTARRMGADSIWLDRAQRLVDNR